jgi:hypothetical protein
MGTKDKLEVAKSILATCFLTATDKSLASGLQYSYKSYPVEDISFSKEDSPIKGWAVDIIVKELGYGENTIQQFLYQRPDNIDHLNMEFNVLLDIISNLTQTALITWNETAKLLNRDKDLQKEIKDAKKNN